MFTVVERWNDPSPQSKMLKLCGRDDVFQRFKLCNLEVCALDIARQERSCDAFVILSLQSIAPTDAALTFQESWIFWPIAGGLKWSGARRCCYFWSLLNFEAWWCQCRVACMRSNKLRSMRSRRTAGRVIWRDVAMLHDVAIFLQQSFSANGPCLSISIASLSIVWGSHSWASIMVMKWSSLFAINSSISLAQEGVSSWYVTIIFVQYIFVYSTLDIFNYF